MDKTQVLEILKEIFTTKLLASIFIVVLAIILYKVIMTVLEKGSKRSTDSLLAKGKNRTYFELAKNIISSLILVVTILILLQVNGVNVSSLLAGVGIAGIVVGLAIQDWLKDIIRGTTILSDDYFSVGDIVSFEGREGEIMSFGLKTTKIRDLGTGNIISIANRKIEQIEVVPDQIFYRIPIPYEVALPDADKAVGDVIELMKKSDLIEEVVNKGVADLADSKIEYLCVVRCSAKDKMQARRDCNRAVVEGLAANGISVPYHKLELVGDKE